MIRRPQATINLGEILRVPELTRRATTKVETHTLKFSADVAMEKWSDCSRVQSGDLDLQEIRTPKNCVEQGSEERRSWQRPNLGLRAYRQVGSTERVEHASPTPAKITKAQLLQLG